MQSQKLAVMNTLLSILSTRGVEYTLDNKETTLKSVLEPADLAEARKVITEGFLAGTINLSADAQAKYLNNEKGMKSYVSGLVNNWIKKEPSFNCGIKYEPKNKGSRAGSGDEQIREMRKLLKTPNLTQEATDEINAAIKDRLAVIKPSTVVEVNVDALPEHLKHLVK